MNKVVIPKESNETKKLKEEDKVSDALLAQAKEKAEIASQEAKCGEKKKIEVYRKGGRKKEKKEGEERREREEEKKKRKEEGKKKRGGEKLASL